jgi:hypothetical protein
MYFRTMEIFATDPVQCGGQDRDHGDYESVLLILVKTVSTAEDTFFMPPTAARATSVMSEQRIFHQILTLLAGHQITHLQIHL